MQTRTVTERIGECLGPVDWSFDFKSLDWGEGRGGINPEHSARTKDWLKEIEADPQKYMATTDGGWPKIGWKRVIQVGMYDGWPFWKPIPSFQLAGPLGAEWHPWYSLSGFEKMRFREDVTSGSRHP